ncbi:acylneuraminate cytidylyltransferase family protein [Vibrio cholerae]|uniref:acylneuraminate cytidylyltransferase family protein n=1 Tax=Vibrio cholerae TaxID=666 RepID=UPI001ECC12CD|nr:acylneuraminate cytidylyltransferase family protein [Vibrio cholerae]EGQ7944305.1 acylneuraminate cytidylyltransferase family protein [Vibrio cholerae]MDV2397113.1 acylneuraminate cytidylyltransferase family protein [Vibrio cholerae]
MIALIPARGGSKGLPGKNIKILGGKPLIAHTIDAAKACARISKVFVSTDDEEIRAIAMEYGADDIGLRPKHLAQDNSKVIDTYNYSIRKIKEIYNTELLNLCVLQPTSPLRSSEDIDKAIELFEQKNADSVISYTTEHHPVLWHKYLNDDLTLTNIFEESLENRQSLKQSVFPNGAIYVFSSSLLKSGKYSSDKTFGYIMPRSRSVDIDTLDDFMYAEFLLSKYNANKK